MKNYKEPNGKQAKGKQWKNTLMGKAQPSQ